MGLAKWTDEVVKNIGEVIDEKYKLLEELGQGGMGIVYKADQIKPVEGCCRGIAKLEDASKRF